MENKKTKLTISGTTKKSIRNIEFAKTKGKNSVIIEKNKSNFIKKGSSYKSSSGVVRSKNTKTSFSKGTPYKTPLYQKIHLLIMILKSGNLLNKEPLKD